MARNDGILGIAILDMDHLAGQQFDIRGAEARVGDLCQHLVVFYLRRRNIRVLNHFRLHKADSFHIPSSLLHFQLVFPLDPEFESLPEQSNKEYNSSLF